MQTSGLVLDLFDDVQGEVLRSIYPTEQDLPEKVKTAHALSSSEREKLPDDAFALVLLNGEQKLRKFACIDGGNTTLSVNYFLKTAHKLPVEAQKVAAENLIQACGWYDIEVPEALQKLAFLGTAMNALTVIPTVTGTAHEMKNRLQENKVLGAGGHVVTPDERAAFRMKTAEVTGTVDMPLSASGGSPTPSKTVVKKTAAEMPHLVRGHKGDGTPPETNVGTMHKEQPKALPQAKALRPHINVSGMESPKAVTEKAASAYALPSQKKYPLDSYAQVKTASEYFDSYKNHFTPEERHEYCVHLVKRASVLGIPVSEDAQKYGSEAYAPEEEIKFAFVQRERYIKDIDGAIEVLEGIYKSAGAVDPELFCATLSEFDKALHLDTLYDSDIPDAHWSTYGTKLASPWSEVIGNDTATEEGLKTVAVRHAETLRGTFGDDFLDEFRKDPVGIFKSLPVQQKKILMRLSHDKSQTGNNLMV